MNTYRDLINQGQNATLGAEFASELLFRGKKKQQHKGNVKISLGKWVGGGIMPTKKSETYGE